MSRQIAFFTFVLLLPLSAYGSATFLYSEPDGSEAHEMVVENGNVYIGDDEGGMLYVSADDQFYVLNHEDKVAINFNEEDAAGMADSMMARIEKELANLPPDQAAAMRSMMKQNMPVLAEEVKSEARETGKSSTVNGFKCREWIVSIGGKDSVRNCIAPASELKIKKSDYAAIRATFSKIEKVFSSFSRSFGNEDPGFGFGIIDGVPVRVESLSDGETSALNKVTSDAEPGRTALPPDYEIQSITDSMR